MVVFALVENDEGDVCISHLILSYFYDLKRTHLCLCKGFLTKGYVSENGDNIINPIITFQWMK